MTTLTVLSENSVRSAGLLAEHGLAWWIDTGRHRVLFDTGQGMVLLHNAGKLGIDLSRADAIVLSHGHYHHVGGLQDMFQVARGAALFMHPGAVEPKFSGAGRRSRRISTEFMESQRFDTGDWRVFLAREPMEVVPGFWMTGEIPRAVEFEDTGGPFFLDEGLSHPDPLLDDQALFFASGAGVIVVLGCAHAGVVNTMRHIKRLTGHAPLEAVLGGAHLEAASESRMDGTVEALRVSSPGLIGFNHCTGRRAILRMECEFGERCVTAHVGTRWEFPSASV